MDTITQLDGQLLIGIQNVLYADQLTPVMKAITYLGEKGIFWILICLILILFRRTRRLGFICALALLANFIVCNLTLKPLVDRIRPWVMFEAVNRLMPDPGDASFPSGHSSAAMAPAWAMFLATMPVRLRRDDGKRGSVSYEAVPCLGWRGEGISPRTMHGFSVAGVVLAVLIGISRLYLGMHYPTDVVCGLLIGMIVATLIYKLILMTEERRGLMGDRPSGDPSETK